MLYSGKKQQLYQNVEPMMENEHVASTYTSLNHNKHKQRKRAQSAHSFAAKNDKKILTKLLNMSII